MNTVRAHRGGAAHDRAFVLENDLRNDDISVGEGERIGIWRRVNIVMPTCDEITKAVGKYNSENSTYDHALKSALGTIQSVLPSSGRFLAEVCLIADWGSIPLNNFSFHDRVAMAEEIETSWPVLQPMRSWHAENWDAETKMLTDAVGLLLSDTHLLPRAARK